MGLAIGRLKLKDGSVHTVFFHGPEIEHNPCIECGFDSSLLCDFPVSDGKTCDAKICESCAHEIGPNMHYCNTHFAMWEEYQKSGALREALSNVIPFRKRT